MYDNTLVVNLFGAPGAGKSTAMAYIFAKLKLKNVDCEMSPEFIKRKIWEGHSCIAEYQTYVTSKQLFGIQSLNKKVRVIITDSPILLGLYYCKKKSSDEDYEDYKNFVFEQWDNFNNMNFYLNRVKPYNANGRFQNEKESDIVSDELKVFLNDYGITYDEYNGDEESYNKIVDVIIDYLN
jgi:nicotinamide riboside kinase